MAPGGKDVAAAIAKTAIAALFTGPVGAVAEGLNQAVAFFSEARPKSVKAIIRSLGDDLDAFAKAEGLPSSTREQALAAAESAIATAGASLAECVDLGLDPDRIANRVLGRSAAGLEGLDEAAKDACRRVVRLVYRDLLADPDALTGLDREFQRHVVGQLKRLDELPGETAAAVRRLAGVSLEADPRQVWREDRFPRSALVRAEFAAVPFHGRQAELVEFADWCAHGPDLALRLYVGPGGMGKTRLMIEACSMMRARRWRAGFLAIDGAAIVAGQPLRELELPSLVVLDYAELKRPELRELLLQALSRADGPPIRLVALARSRGDWWLDLARSGQGIGDFVVGPATSTKTLPPLAGTEEERRHGFEHAAQAFAAKLDLEAPPTPDDLGEEHYERALFIHLAALSGVLGNEVGSRRDLLDFALRREQRFWDEGMVSAGLEELCGRPVAQAAALVTLGGSVASREAAIELIAKTPLLAGQPAAATAAVAEMFHRLYPGERWLEGVQPDLLGEHLIYRVGQEDAAVLGAFGG